MTVALSTLNGLVRECRRKPAGLRTHTLVGVASAVIMLVTSTASATYWSQGTSIGPVPSRRPDRVRRTGYIEAGVIFGLRDAVRGHTTAAVVWLVEALGMACGDWVPGLALA